MVGEKLIDAVDIVLGGIRGQIDNVVKNRPKLMPLFVGAIENTKTTLDQLLGVLRGE
jgi:hypothetical protein